MDPGWLDVLHQSADHHLTVAVGQSIHVDFSGVFEVLINQDRLFGIHLHGLAHVAVQFIGAKNNFHGPATEHIAGPHHHGVADALSDRLGLRFAAGDAIGGLADLKAPEHGFKLLAIFRQVDGLR